VTDALDAVVDAAIERALVDDDARRYFALAGALDRVRTGDSGPAEAAPPAVDRFGAALASTVAVRALDASDTDAIANEAWGPGKNDPHADLVAAGAAAAYRRFDVDLDRVATQSGIDGSELARRL